METLLQGLTYGIGAALIFVCLFFVVKKIFDFVLYNMFGGYLGNIVDNYEAYLNLMTQDPDFSSNKPRKFPYRSDVKYEDFESFEQLTEYEKNYI